LQSLVLMSVHTMLNHHMQERCGHLQHRAQQHTQT
jgi:hypothetical protein